MNNSRYRIRCLSCLAGVLAMSFYPVFMGVKVLTVMMTEGVVPYEEYPKYIIPYTPVAVSLILGVLLMPLIQRLSVKFDLLIASVFSSTVFFLTEWFMETRILVRADWTVTLGSWQMSLCYVPPEQYRTRTWEAVDILLGGYSPSFKIHFYLISVVLITSFLNCFYGWAKMALTGDCKRKKALTVQAVTAVVFLGMCIWACFTSFYRTGELIVRPVSAVLMSVFFALLGITMGVFAGSFTLGKGRLPAVLMPSVVSVLVTAAMYFGELKLLNRHLYRFGKGFFFEGLGKLVLAPADIAVILSAGLFTVFICLVLNRRIKI